MPELPEGCFGAWWLHSVLQHWVSPRQVLLRLAKMNGDGAPSPSDPMQGPLEGDLVFWGSLECSSGFLWSMSD